MTEKTQIPQGRAEGGQLWIPETTPSRSAGLSKKETRNLAIVVILSGLFLIIVFVALATTANSNYINTEGNVVTVTSYKLSFQATIVLFITVMIPTISTLTISLLNWSEGIPLRSTWKELKKGTQFEDTGNAITLFILLSVLSAFLSVYISIQMMPFSKSYEYTDPHTGQAVKLHVQPYMATSTIDADIANVINTKTGAIDKTQELPVKISDLNVTPFKSTYTITHEPLENLETVPLEEQLDFTEVTPNPGEKIKIFKDGTYEIIETE